METVGYIYMVAGGAPERNTTHVKDVADLSLTMIEEVSKVKFPEGINVTIKIGKQFEKMLELKK